MHLDSEYTQWLRDIKERFRSAQIKAAVKVNSEQLLFNWQLGRDLVLKKAEEKWGSGIVEQVSLDLQNEFPKAKGFGTSNLWYMKKWYRFYSEADDAGKLQQLIGEFQKNEKLQQLGAEIEFPSVFGYVPWRYHKVSPAW